MPLPILLPIVTLRRYTRLGLSLLAGTLRLPLGPEQGRNTLGNIVVEGSPGSVRRVLPDRERHRAGVAPRGRLRACAH